MRCCLDEAQYSHKVMYQYSVSIRKINIHILGVSEYVKYYLTCVSYKIHVTNLF